MEYISILFILFFVALMATILLKKKAAEKSLLEGDEVPPCNTYRVTRLEADKVAVVIYLDCSGIHQTREPEYELYITASEIKQASNVEVEKIV